MLTILLVGILSGCSGLLHKPNPDLDLPLEERPWRVRCGWYRPLRPTDDRLSNPRESGWEWGTDTAGRRLLLNGRLEDGFFVVDTVRAQSDKDERDVEPYRATAVDLHQACTTGVADGQDDDRPRVYSVMAARDGENIEVPIVVAGDSARPRPVSRMVVFGDSLSDNGNLLRRLLVFPRSPYWLGRFTNGPNWTDYVSERTGIAVQNQAYGGAAIVAHDDAPTEGVVSAVEQGAQYFLTGSIQNQVTHYLEHELHGGPIRQPQDVVFVLWGGSIDYMIKEPFTGEITTLLDTPEGTAGYKSIVRDAVASLTEQVRRLHAAGARQLLIVNLPDIGQSPIVLQNKSYLLRRAKNDVERRLVLSRKLGELSAYHNQQLARAVTGLVQRFPDSKIAVVDVAEQMNRILSSRALDDGKKKFDYGFALRERETELSHGTRRGRFQQRCYSGGYLGSVDASSICPQSRNALFWDVVHPTSYTHCWLAFGMQRALAKAGFAKNPPPLEQQRAYCTARTQPGW